MLTYYKEAMAPSASPDGARHRSVASGSINELGSPIPRVKVDLTGKLIHLKRFSFSPISGSFYRRTSSVRVFRNLVLSS